MSQRKDIGGYLRFPLQKGRYRREFVVHALVAIFFIAPFREGLEVNHKDGDKQNNRADNLEWVTHSANVKHAIDNGLKKHIRHKPFPKGSEHPYSKKVLCIEQGIIYDTVTEAAKAVNGNHSKIAMAARGERKTSAGYTWKYI